MSEQGKPDPTIPRPSASLIILNDRNEVLMVQRNPRSRSFAGAHVFPGGNFDAQQDESLAMTALRETFEETGVLLASDRTKTSQPKLNEVAIEAARDDIHCGKQLFTKFLSDYGLKLNVESFLPFTEWVTPPPIPRRFHTRFFVTFLPLASSVAGPTSGTHHHRLPTPDTGSSSTVADNSFGSEVISARYVHPRELLNSCASGTVELMPPQFYLLSTLADVFDSDLSPHKSTSLQQSLVRRLSSGTFGKMVINPRMLPEEDSDGRRALVFEGDETRGGKKGRLHRVLMPLVKSGGVPSGLALLRNFDIYEEVEEDLFSARSKL